MGCVVSQAGLAEKVGRDCANCPPVMGGLGIGPRV